jgi:hypothetical protein
MKRLLAVVLLCAAACGGGSSSVEGSVSGTVTNNGVSVTFSNVSEADAITYTGAACSGSGQQSTVAIVLDDRGGFCGSESTQSALANSDALLLAITGQPASSGAAAPAIGPGTYPIASTQTDSSGNIFAGSLTLASFDGTCHQTDGFAIGGTITLTSVSGGEVAGQFNATFAGGSFTGSFDAPPCSISAAQFCNQGSFSGCTP